MSFFGMSNQYDFVSNGRVVYKGTRFTEYEAVEEDTPKPKDFSQLWAHIEAGIPLLVLGCATAYVEDNGFNPPPNVSDLDSNWFCFGKALGHAIVLAQATGEIAQGLGLIGAGVGGGAILAAPSGGTSVVVGGTLVTVGAVEVTHGSLVGKNAIKNTLDDGMFFSKRGGGGNGGSGGGKKYYRSKSERRKALLRDADDPNSELTAEARKFIKDNNGDKVPNGYEVSHETPLYTKKTIEGKKEIDKEWNLKTIKKTTHKERHKVCGDQYHYFPKNN